MVWLWVALGSALGGMARYGVGLLTVAWWGTPFPWGTLLINIFGSFVIVFFGTLTAAFGPFPAPSDLRTFVMVGLCGGFTTFSSFSQQTLELIRGEALGAAAAYVGLSVGLGLLAAAAGYLLAVRIAGGAG